MVLSQIFETFNLNYGTKREIIAQYTHHDQLSSFVDIPVV